LPISKPKILRKLKQRFGAKPSATFGTGPVDEGAANPQAVLPLQQAKRFAKTPV
jgi:hypothetical protein